MKNFSIAVISINLLILIPSVTFSAVQDEKDSSLVVVDYQVSDGSFWDPVPVNVPVGQERYSILHSEKPDAFSGNVIYALADYCNMGLDCEADHQFTLSVNADEKSCTLDKTELGNKGDLWKYYLTAEHQQEEDSLLCDVNVESQYMPSIKVKITNYTAANGQGAVLAFGWVNTYDKTSCFAENFMDCTEAAHLELVHGYTSALFTFTADPDVNLLDATISYPIIKDPELPEASHVILVTLQNGEEVMDRCKAEVFPPIISESVRYSVYATQSGSDVDNLCQVYVMREEIPVHFQLNQ